MSQPAPLLNNEQLIDVFAYTKTATAIHVGEDATVQLANQAMLDIWGKDKSVIGKPLDEALPELKGQPFIDMFRRVWLEGLTISGTDTAADLIIDGTLKTFYFDFEYRAIKDADGKTICILHSAIDVTERFLKNEILERAREKEEALQREQALNEELAASVEELESLNEELQQSQESLNEINAELEERVQRRTRDLAGTNEELAAVNEELAAVNEEMSSTNEELLLTQESLQQMIIGLAESDSRFRSLVEQAPVAITVLQGPGLVIDIVNEKMLEVWSKTKDIVGKPLAIAMPELEGQPFLDILGNVLVTGKPYYGYESRAYVVRDGVPVEGYFNFICQPIKDTSGETTSVLQVVTEITDQVNAHLKIQKAEEMMRLAVEAAQLGSWNIDPVTKKLRYNQTLARIFGYEGSEPMTYEQAIAQVSEGYRDEITAKIEEAIAKGGDYDMIYSQRRFNDGELIWLRSAGRITTDDNDEFTVFSGVVMDITEQKRDEIRKSDFIGMVSHELKTPLTSLNAYLQVLQGKAKKHGEDTFTTGALDQSVKQVKRMTTMINGFLNVSRLESGKISIDKTNFNMADLIREMEDETVSMNVTHTIIFHPVEPIFIDADKDKIGQVISNLISNAVKYSQSGSTVQIACVEADGYAQVTVSDEGIGINPHDATQLFERYYRVESLHTKHISGFGIGLYLSAEIIARHHGKIWVDSEVGKGSTFYFRLPL